MPNKPQNPTQNTIDFDTNTTKQESKTKSTTQTKQTKDGLANDEVESLEHTLQRVKNREKDRANNQNPPKKPKALDKQNLNEPKEADLENEASEGNKDTTNIKTKQSKTDKKEKKDKKQKRKWNELFEDNPSKENPQGHKNEQNPQKPQNQQETPHKEQNQKTPHTTKPKNPSHPTNNANPQPKQKLDSSDTTKRGA